MTEQNNPQQQLDNIFSLTQEEFKGINQDLWIDLAVRQCLSTALVNPMAYALAVRNLESVCINKKDDEYNAAINKKIKEYHDDQITKDNQIDILIAPTRFDELMRLIDRKKAHEALFEL
jgi:hypothetical protein